MTDPAARSATATPDEFLAAWQSGEGVRRWMSHDDARDAQLRDACALLPFPADATIRVLDVGGGHGPFTLRILEAYPRSTVCLQDFSEPLIREATSRLAWFPGRFRVHRSDLRDPGWAAGLDGPFDAVVSAIVFHGLEPDTIRRLYGDIAGLLRPGGCFLNLDLILQPPGSSTVAGIYRAAPSAESSQFSHDDDHRHGSAAPALDDHLRWLRDAGFGEVDCVWKRFRQALLCAIRTDAGPAADEGVD